LAAGDRLNSQYCPKITTNFEQCTTGREGVEMNYF